MYAKVYKSMWEGTLAGTGEVWAVFVFLLAHCDREGFVDIHPGVVSALTGFEEIRVREALRALEAPDAQSRTAEDGGARIVRLDGHRDWGWQIVNYVKYRTLVDADTRRAQVREAVKRHRNPPSSSVIIGKPSKSQVDVDVDVDVDTDAEAKTNPCRVAPDADRVPLREWQDFFLDSIWPARPRRHAPGVAGAESKRKASEAWARLHPKQLPREEAETFANSILSALRRDVSAMRDEKREASKYPHLVT